MSIKTATALLISVFVFMSPSNANPVSRSAHSQDGRTFSCAGQQGLFPDPHDCTMFYSCATGHPPFHMSCGPGTHFSPVHKVCDWPASAGCVVQDEQNSISDANAFSCDGQQGLFPDPEDCTMFYQCSTGHPPFHRACPAGLHFNPGLKRCDWPASAGCVVQGEQNIISDHICAVPIPPSNGHMSGSGTSLGSTYTFSCNHGYQLHGAGSITCTEEGWSAGYPICHPIRCGIPAVRSEQARNRIVGGHEVEPGSQPWVVSFQHPLYPLPNFNLCGGSLIAPNLVVTAAHCFRPLEQKPQTGWVAHLAEHNLYEDEGTEQNITVQDIMVHEDFEYSGALTNDIALVRLSRPAHMNDYVSPICLPEPGEKVGKGTLCTTAGWGYTKPLGVGDVQTGDFQSATLQEADLPIVSNRECGRKLPDYEIFRQQICAGFDEGGVDTCVGDSGGPLACRGDNDRMTIQGITSFGDKGTCAQPVKPGVYTRVASFISWLREHVTEHEWEVITSYV